ncbi:MAG: hypothetical protein E6J90_08900 [Deltaproteobacteria bacterium]|nr:MAG: hypothetical protein E6J90_08900 [Deltaproteobacteria bacterium]
MSTQQVLLAEAGGGPGWTSWNPSDVQKITLSNNNLTAVTTGATNPVGVRAVSGASTGKRYWEVTMTAWVGNGTGIGLATLAAVLFGGAVAGQAVVTKAITSFGGIQINGTYSGVALGSVTDGGIVGIAVDLTAGLIWFKYLGSNWNNSGTANPATGVGGISLGALSGTILFPFLGAASSGVTATANFGASAFIGAVPAGFTSGWPA